MSESHGSIMAVGRWSSGSEKSSSSATSISCVRDLPTVLVVELPIFISSAGKSDPALRSSKSKSRFVSVDGFAAMTRQKRDALMSATHEHLGRFDHHLFERHCNQRRRYTAYRSMQHNDRNALGLELAEMVLGRVADGWRHERDASHPFIHQLQDNVALLADLVARGANQNLVVKLAGGGSECIDQGRVVTGLNFRQYQSESRELCGLGAPVPLANNSTFPW